MSTKLDYILKRNNSTLLSFIQKNQLTSYNDLLDYCKQRNFIPCTREDYDEVVVVDKKVVEQNERKVSRKVSKTQEPKKRRYSRKKKQTTPKVSKSSNSR